MDRPCGRLERRPTIAPFNRDTHNEQRGITMKRILLAASFAALLLSTSVAFAGGKGNGHGGGHDGHPPGKHKGWHKDKWRRGDRIEIVHVERRYYIDDYAHYHLRQPPRGHRWIRTPDGKFILVAVATGIIADILLHH
jgi:Ni/Co efflux regulator RcnB